MVERILSELNNFNVLNSLIGDAREILRKGYRKACLQCHRDKIERATNILNEENYEY